MSKKLVYVGFAYKHHKGTHAGYHRIKDFLKYDHLIECQREFEFLFFDVKEASLIKRLLRRVYARVFGDGCPLAMFRALCYSWSHSEDVVFHLIYGDNLYGKLLYHLKRKNHKVVATIHQPFDSYMCSSKMKNKLLMPDKLIILSNNELKLFNEFTCKNNVVHIPHGICTDFYKPLGSKQISDQSVLMVGNWLRDFNLAEKVFKELSKDYPNVRIDVVGSKANKERFCKISNYHNNISDEKLLKLYQNCNVVYLPLLRFTANNALLEAAATGCKIVISTDNMDDNTYIPSEYISIVNRTSEDSINEILRNMQNIEPNYSLRQFIIQSFSWEVVGNNVKYFLLNNL